MGHVDDAIALLHQMVDTVRGAFGPLQTVPGHGDALLGVVELVRQQVSDIESMAVQTGSQVQARVHELTGTIRNAADEMERAINQLHRPWDDVIGALTHAEVELQSVAAELGRS